MRNGEVRRMMAVSESRKTYAVDKTASTIERLYPIARLLRGTYVCIVSERDGLNTPHPGNVGRMDCIGTLLVGG